MITATLFLVFAVITILGMPIALALVGGGMAAIVAGDLMPLFTSVQKMFSSVDSFTLAAIPFFMLAGALMSSGGISRRRFSHVCCLAVCAAPPQQRWRPSAQ